jgi:hypothetical protein
MLLHLPRQKPETKSVHNPDQNSAARDGSEVRSSTCESERPLVRSTPNASSTCEDGRGDQIRERRRQRRGVRWWCWSSALPPRRIWRRRPPWSAGAGAWRRRGGVIAAVRLRPTGKEVAGFLSSGFWLWWCLASNGGICAHRWTGGDEISLTAVGLVRLDRWEHMGHGEVKCDTSDARFCFALHRRQPVKPTSTSVI